MHILGAAHDSIHAKIVIAGARWAVGGGHSLHVVCDGRLHPGTCHLNKRIPMWPVLFRYGSAYLAKHIGQKRAREIFFLGLEYSAQAAFDMGMVNAVVTHAEIETQALAWAELINAKSPTAMRMLKYGFNATDDGMVGQQLFAGEATRLAYGTAEAKEGRDAFVEKRPQDYSSFGWAH